MASKRKKVQKREWAVLTPRELPNGKWLVSLGVNVENGKRKNPRRTFQNNADALQFCRDEEARRKAHGQITANADGVKVAAWLELEEQLIEAGAGTLKEVGQRVLRDTLAIKKSANAADCLAMYLTRHLEPGVYVDDSRTRCNRFVKWFGPDRQIKEATDEVMQAFFLKHTGATLRRNLSAWLGWSVDQGYLASNPCARKRQRRGVKKKKTREAVILSPTEAAILLRAAVNAKDWTSLTFISISLFAGLRPMEFRKKSRDITSINLEWNHISSDGISINNSLAKTIPRVAPMIAPLPLWIDLIKKERGMVSLPVLAAGKRGGGWRDHWEKFLADHWQRKWNPDQLRHSFGSYRMATLKNAGQVALEMGNSAQVVLDHYWNWQTKARDAETYWNLTPDVVMNTPLNK